MYNKISPRDRTVIVLVFGIVSTFIYLFLSNGLTQYGNQAFIIAICNLFMCICLVYIVSREDLYMFDPIVFAWALYYMIFVFVPFKNIMEDKVTEFGVNVMGGCIKGTIVFMLGFVGLMLGYYSNKRITIGKFGLHHFQTEEYLPLDENSAKKTKVLRYCWLFWGIGVASFMLFMLTLGQNPLYLLTFGLKGGVSAKNNNYSVSFLSQLIYLSFYPLIVIVYYEKSKLLKLIALFFVLAPLVTRGFRNVVVVVLAGIVIFYYVRSKRSMTIKVIAACLAIFLLIFGVMGNTRNYTRKGTTIDMSSYQYSDGLDGVLYYFETYKCYYGAVEHYPKDYDYTLGKQLSYAVLMYIPRAIWPSKPDTPIREVLANSTSPISVEAGSIMPNIGEYYTEFGIMGAFFLMMIFGYILNKMKRLYLYPNNKERRIMLYSLFLPSLVTIIPYGYTAGNLPPFVLMSVPVILQKYIITDD